MLLDTPRVDHNLLDGSKLSQADGEHQPHANLPPEATVQILTHSRGLLTDLQQLLENTAARPPAACCSEVWLGANSSSPYPGRRADF